MKIFDNYVKSMSLTFDNGYTVNVAMKDGRGTHSWISYMIIGNVRVISVNEWANDDTVARFISRMQQWKSVQETSAEEAAALKAKVKKEFGCS